MSDNLVFSLGVLAVAVVLTVREIPRRSQVQCFMSCPPFP